MTSLPGPIRLIPLPDFPEVEPGADLAALIRQAARSAAVDRHRRLTDEYLDHVAKRRDPEVSQELLGQRPGSHSDGRLPGTGPLKDRADRPEVFHRPAKVAVAGPRPFHFLHPLQLVILIDHPKGDGAAERCPAPDAGENLDRVGLDPLSTAPAVSSLAAEQLCVDPGGVNLDPPGEAIDQSQHPFAVRLAGGPIS